MASKAEIISYLKQITNERSPQGQKSAEQLLDMLCPREFKAVVELQARALGNQQYLVKNFPDTTKPLPDRIYVPAGEVDSQDFLGAYTYSILLYRLGLMQLTQQVQKVAESFDPGLSRSIKQIYIYWLGLWDDAFPRAPLWVSETQPLTVLHPELPPEVKTFLQKQGIRPESDSLVSSLWRLANRKAVVTAKNLPDFTAFFKYFLQETNRRPNPHQDERQSIGYPMLLAYRQLENAIPSYVQAGIRPKIEQLAELLGSFPRELVRKLATQASDLSWDELDAFKLLDQVLTDADSLPAFAAVKALDESIQGKQSDFTVFDLYANLRHLVSETDSQELFEWYSANLDLIYQVLQDKRNLWITTAATWNEVAGNQFWGDSAPELNWEKVRSQAQRIRELQKRQVTRIIFGSKLLSDENFGFQTGTIFARLDFDWKQDRANCQLFVLDEGEAGDQLTDRALAVLDFVIEIKSGQVTWRVVDPENVSQRSAYNISQFISAGLSLELVKLEEDESRLREAIRLLLQSLPENSANTRPYLGRRRKKTTDAEEPTTEITPTSRPKSIVVDGELADLIVGTFDHSLPVEIQAKLDRYHLAAEQGHNVADGKLLTQTNYYAHFMPPNGGRVWQVSLNIRGAEYRVLAEVNPNDESQAIAYAIVPRNQMG